VTFFLVRDSVYFDDKVLDVVNDNVRPTQDFRQQNCHLLLVSKLFNIFSLATNALDQLAKMFVPVELLLPGPLLNALLRILVIS
jgi:hypothetical protein